MWERGMIGSGKNFVIPIAYFLSIRSCIILHYSVLNFKLEIDFPCHIILCYCQPNEILKSNLI